MSIREKGSLQVRHAFPAYRVFIFGTEVTEDVLDVNVQYNIGRAPNTCTITLANELDKYILTTKDFNILFSNDSVREAIKRASSLAVSTGGYDANNLQQNSGGVIDIESEIDRAIIENVKSIEPKLKRDILRIKSNIKSKGVQQPNIAGKLNSIDAQKLTNDAYRYPFQAEDPIFHANDPMRVFMRDPFNPKIWYHMFAGFLSDFDDSVDENLQATLTVTAEGPSKILRYARITTNPGMVDIKAIEQSEDAAKIRSAHSESFSGLTLPEILFTTIFGNNPEIEGPPSRGEEDARFKLTLTSKYGQTIRKAALDAVGNFNFKNSVTLEFGPEENDSLVFSGSSLHVNKINSLSTYQSIIDHEVKELDLLEMAREEDLGDVSLQARTLRTDEKDNILIEEVIKALGTRIDLYPVDGGRLILLIPKSFQQEVNRESLLKDVLKSFALKTDFKSRLGMIYNVIERIEFVFYESPKGDLICEFPLYDFDPEDFGDSRVSHFSTIGGKVSEKSKIKRGPFGPRYRISKRDTFNFSKGISDEKIRTQVVSSWYPAQNWTEVGTVRNMLAPAVVTLRHLVPLYWLRLEEVDPKGFISTKAAAQLYAHVLLNKTNADARNLGINALPNLGLWLNRPIFFKPRNCIGVLMGLGHDVKWGMGGSMGTRLNLNYIRGWDGLLDDAGKKMVYTPIGGQPSRPLDYKLLFKLKDASSGGETLPSQSAENGDK